MKHPCILIGLSLLFGTLSLQSQQADTLLVYDMATHVKSKLPPVPVPATVTAEHTSPYTGLLSGTQSLLTNFPITNLIQNTNFSNLARASNFYNLATYPARTAVKIVHYYQGKKGIMSGMLVSPCLVLTAGQIIFGSGISPIKNFQFDSIRVLPAFDNGAAQPGLPTSLVEKIYLFNNYVNSAGPNDFSLLKLALPIGGSVGWTGIGFDADTAFTRNKLFHKFSYPAVRDFFDTTKVYNGDTLYYNYGAIRTSNLYYDLRSGAALPGQGGSTFLYFDGTDHYNVGTLSYSTNYIHYRITKEAYFQLKNILFTANCGINTLGISKQEADLPRQQVFPNPALTEFSITQLTSQPSLLFIRLFDYSGRLVRQFTSNEQIITVPRNALPVGIYLLTVAEENQTLQTYKIVFE